MHVSKTLPNCLLIGDSVAHGTYGEYPWNFTGSVQDLLKDTCPVFNIEGTDSFGEHECFWSQGTDAATGLPVRWKAIHYNEGLHSLWPRVNTSAGLLQYAATLGEFTDALKETGAALVYGTMTPFMPEKYQYPPRFQDDVEIRPVAFWTRSLSLGAREILFLSVHWNHDIDISCAPSNGPNRERRWR
jgi:hypothetical protein